MDPRYVGANALLPVDDDVLSRGMHGLGAMQMNTPHILSRSASPTPAPAMRSAMPQQPMVQAGGRGAAAAPEVPINPANWSPEQVRAAMRNMLKAKYGEMGMQMEDKRLDELTDFAVAKRSGRMAKQMDKKKKAALAKYFSSLVAKENAEQHFAQSSQRVQSDIAAAVAERDEEKMLHLKDQLGALKSQMDAKRQRAAGFRHILEKRHQIPAKHLADPVSLFAFIHDDEDDDYSDILNDDEGQ